MQTRTLSLLIVCMLVTACGSSESEAPAAPTPQSASSAPARASSSLSTRIRAIAVASGDQPMSLEFELLARPALSEAVAIKLYLLGASEATELQLAVNSDQLQVLEGAQATFPVLKAGETLEHSIQVRSEMAGLKIVEVRVQSSVAGKPKTLSFSIPVAFVVPDAK